MHRSEFDLHVDNKKLKSCFSFRKDLQVGAVGESYVNTIFGENETSLEVKKDDWAVKSGKIAIEFESRGKPSGILVTKSDFWCHVIGHYFVLVFPVDFLRKVYDKFHQDAKYVKSLGDRDAGGNPLAKAILIPWRELLDLFKTYQPNERPNT